MDDRAHVLVVEDNELVSGAFRILLESTNHRVSVAPGVAATLEIVARDPPDLVFLDLTLPDGNGLDLVSPLLAAGCHAVVVLTGHDDDETRARCLAAGCTDVLVKPISSRDLLTRSAAWLGTPPSPLQ